MMMLILMSSETVKFQNCLVSVSGILTEASPEEKNPVPVAVQCRFLASAYLGVLESWLERGAAHSPGELGQ